MLRVMACDDEPLALQRIADLLAACDGVTLVETLLDAREVAAAVRDHRPDLLLLDVEMPKLRGFDVIDRLADEAADDYFPQVALITAHAEFAATAYEAGALDFLTKPVRLKRLELTLDRARAALAQKSATARLAAVTAELERLRGSAAGDDAQPGQLWIRSRGERIRVDTDQIIRIEAEGVYARVFTRNANYLHRETIASLADRLDRRRFARVHRGAIVRLDYIAGLKRTVHGALTIRLATGEELRVGRTYRDSLSALLAKREG